ncbi:MAG: hypothetical protein GF329_18380 [Candidatus Lokiarchaeota archaeon]|nr:hypothetical protein [Candidatus Lokiarchaeota archaeon]
MFVFLAGGYHLKTEFRHKKNKSRARGVKILNEKKSKEIFQKKSIRISIIAIIAALYAVLVIIFFQISYGILQVRIADALMPTSIIFGIPGSIALYIGCLIGNSFYASGLTVPIFDIVFGPIANFISGIIGYFLHRRFKLSGWKKILWTQFVILLQNINNSVIVGIYLPFALFGFWDPFFAAISILGIFCGSLISMNLLGYFVLKALKRIGISLGSNYQGNNQKRNSKSSKEL